MHTGFTHFETLVNAAPEHTLTQDRVVKGPPPLSRAYRVVARKGAAESSPHSCCSLVKGCEAGRITLQSPVFLAVYIKPDQASKVVPGDGSEQA